MRNLWLFSVIWALFCVLSTPILAKDSGSPVIPPYDELYDKDGNLRPQYELLRPYIERTGPRSRSEFSRYSYRRFGEDNSLSDLPRILTQEEYATVKAGVEQRAAVLRALLRDHYSGRKEYLKAGIVSEATMNRIIGRNFEHSFQNLMAKTDFNFFYGPDLFRAPDGSFVIVEDNIRYVGGIGDLIISYELILERHPQLRQSLSLMDPSQFYAQLVKVYRREARLKGGKAIALFLTPYYDGEDERIKEIYESLGLECITPRSDTKLVFENGKVYTQPKNGGRRERVGFVATSGNYLEFDFGMRANRERYLLDQAVHFVRDEENDSSSRRAIKAILDAVDPATQLPDMIKLEREMSGLLSLGLDRTRYVTGLTEAIVSGAVGSTSPPGVEFVGDKELYLYMDKLTEFYLGEKAKLRSIRTLHFSRKDGALSEIVFAKVAHYKNSWVIKPADGRAGDGLWVGPGVSPSEWRRALKLVRQDPSLYLAQEYIPPSTMRGTIGDIRPITFVGPNETIVGPPWGRNNKGDKINVDKGGAVTAILVTGQCERLLEGQPASN